MASELTQDAVCDFLFKNGGRVKNQTLVTHFRKFINDPQHKDVARQNFKEYVNAVAVVKTENGEKFVQLKRKFRAPSQEAKGEASSEPASKIQHTSNVPETTEKRHSIPKNEQVVKERKHDKTSHQAPPQPPVQATPPSAIKEPVASSTPPAVKDPIKSYTPTKMDTVPYADGQTGDEDSGTVFKKPGTPPSQIRKGSKTAAAHQQLQQQNKPKNNEKSQQPQVNKLPSATVTQRDPHVSRPAPSPTSRKREMSRTQKMRREISGPTDLVHISGTSPNAPGTIDIAKQTALLLERQPRPKSANLAPQPTGAVERARQNFQGKKSEDTSSIAASEKSVDSKEAEQYEDDDRTAPSFIMDATDKKWMLCAARCDMVEIRKMLNNDPTIADKRDFFNGYTALHWSVKKGNIDLVRMFCEIGVDINARTNGGYTALHLAAKHGRDDILKLLIEEFDCNTQLRDYSGHLARDYVKTGSMSLPIQSKKTHGKRRKGTYSEKRRIKDRGQNQYQIIDSIANVTDISSDVFQVINDRTNNIVRRRNTVATSGMWNKQGDRDAPARRNSFTNDLTSQIGNWMVRKTSFRRSGKRGSGKKPDSRTSTSSLTVPDNASKENIPDYAMPQKSVSHSALVWKPAGKKT